MFLDELIWSAKDWTVPLRDRLDAQGAVWGVVKWSGPPPEWSEELWQTLLEFRSSYPVIELGEEEEPVQDLVGQADDSPTVDYIQVAADELHVHRSVLDEIVELLEDKGQVILYGPPGTGKTFFALQLARALTAEDPDRFSLIQIHPATSYEDFFEGLRPAVTDSGQVIYRLTDGPLVIIAEKARASQKEEQYVLVIDEINRANLPKVFGELLFLLEYREQSINTLYRPSSSFTPAPEPMDHWNHEHLRPIDYADRRGDATQVPFRPVLPSRGGNEGPAGVAERRRKDSGR